MVSRKLSEDLPPGWTEFSRPRNPRKIKNVIEVGPVDGLPDGWSKEIRIKRIAGKIRKDPYYKDHVNGFEFRSKKDALRYIETGDCSKCKIKPKKIEAAPLGNVQKYLEKNDVSEHYVLGSQKSISREEEINKLFEDTVEAVKPDLGESTAVDGLPPGWIKEVKPRKAGKLKDRYYVDPISGYMFLSKLDALRYIKTGDIRKCACKPKKRGTDGKQNFDTSTLKIEAESSKRTQENSLSVTAFTDNVAEATPKKSLLKKERKTREIPQISEPIPEVSEKKDVRIAPSIGTVVLDKQEFSTGIMELKTESPSPSRSDTNMFTQSVPVGTSKRLPGTQPETPPNMQLSEQSLRSTTSKSPESEANEWPMMTINVIDSVRRLPDPSKLELDSSDTYHEPKFANDTDKQKNAGSRKKREETVHGRVSKLAGCQPEMPPNLQLSERPLGAAIPMACEDFTMNVVPIVQPQPQPQPLHPNLPLVDANASHELKLPNDNVEHKNGYNAPAGLEVYRRRTENNSRRAFERPVSWSMASTPKRPVAATSGMPSKRLAESQLEPSPVNTMSSVYAVLPQPLQSKPLPGTVTQGEHPAYQIDRILGGTLDPLNTVPIHGVANIVPIDMESISKTDEIETNEQTFVNCQAAVSEVKTGSIDMVASAEMKTVSVETGIQLNKKPEFENRKPQGIQVEQPRHPSTPLGFESLPPFHGIRIVPDTRSKNYMRYRGTSK